MSEHGLEKSLLVFISHASADLEVARQIEAALQTTGFDPWLDYSDIRVGMLLGKQLQQAIEGSVAVVLIWSETAAASRWVATEVLTAFHLDRFIIPCVLSETELPQFLSRSVYFDLHKRQEDVFERIGEQVKKAPRRRNEFAAISSYRTMELKESINNLYQGQREVLDYVGRGDLVSAHQRQTKLDEVMHDAETRWRYDPTILNLAGYHRKNEYMIKHWEEYCAGRFPADPILREGEQFFFNTLFVNPTDYSALNGLGNMLLFEGELDAAEFFMGKAIECATRDGVEYSEAKHDLKVIRSRISATTDRVHFSVTAPPVVSPGTSFLLDVWAHLKNQRQTVKKLAQEAYGQDEIRIHSKGPVEVARGTKLTVQLEIKDLAIKDPQDTILWFGEISNATFSIFVPEGTDTGSRTGTARIHVSGLQIARVYFVFEIGKATLPSITLDSQLKKHRSAFASYASKDRNDVLARIQGMQKTAPQLEIFLDVVSLRSGQDWARELMRVIPDMDIFYLFWSQNASHSEWVDKEWRYALESRGLEFIDPVPLVSPEDVPPPEELAGKHFNDWVLAYMRQE